MLEYKASIDKPNEDGISPLCLAAGVGRLTLVKLLVANALNLEVITNPFTITKQACIDFAKHNNTLPAMQEYFDQHSTSQNDKVSITLLEFAKIMGHREIIDYLSHQQMIANTFVYEHAQQINQHIIEAKKLGLTEMAQMLEQYKQDIIDPSKKIEDVKLILTLPEQKTTPTQESTGVASSSSLFGGASENAKNDFLSALNKRINSFQEALKNKKKMSGLDQR